MLPNELKFKVVLQDGEDAEILKSRRGKDVEQIEWYLDQLRDDINTFNCNLRQKVASLLQFRRKEILRKQNILASIGVPIRQRGNVPQMIPVSISKRDRARILSPLSAEPFSPEPELLDAANETILRTIQNMSVTMERSPSVFIKAEEEEVRDILLVSLNAIFEGEATGETFSVRGKTDIHIAIRGKSVFIAELKIWKGAKSLSDALDQLLSYLAWRNTKSALIVLNKNQNFSQVLDQISATVEQHSCFKRFVKRESETVFRFIFSNKKDGDRQVFLTLLAFHLANAAEP